MNELSKVLTFDIESSLARVRTFDFYEARISHENIEIPPFIHCISYKFLGEKKVHNLCVDYRKPHDDYNVIKEFLKIYESTDYVAGYNSNSFDIPMIMGRAAIHGLKPVSDKKRIDIYRIVKRHFRLPSYKLDYVAGVFGIGRKIKNEPNLWNGAFDGDKKKLKLMAKYCDNDVLITEGLLKKVMRYVKFPNIKKNEEVKCQNPVCDSNEVQFRGMGANKEGSYRKFQCKRCGSWGSIK